MVTTTRRPRTIPLQPHPIRTCASEMPVAGSYVTAIQRTWAPGEARRCRLCPADVCGVRDDVCLITVRTARGLDPADLPLYDCSGGGFAPVGREDETPRLRVVP